MAYDQEYRGGRGRRGGFMGRGEYGANYEGPYLGYAWEMGQLGGALRSRGSWNAGAMRSGREPNEFEWGGGYVGGRGYGGTNFDFDHGYTGSARGTYPSGAPMRRGYGGEFGSPASRGGYSWGEAEMMVEDYGPARYGYGPYFDRLQRRRRPDGDVRQEVEDTLFYDTWVDADAITVQVSDGIVTLQGTLPTYDEVRYAVDDAWDVDGVRGVRSELQVSAREGSGRSGRPIGRGAHLYPGREETESPNEAEDERSTSNRGGTQGQKQQPGTTAQQTTGKGRKTTGRGQTGARGGSRGGGRSAGGSQAGSAAATGSATGSAGRGRRGATAGTQASSAAERGTRATGRGGRGQNVGTQGASSQGAGGRAGANRMAAAPNPTGEATGATGETGRTGGTQGEQNQSQEE